MNSDPLRLEPLLSPRVWGGRRLQSRFGRPLPPNTPVGESWEVHGQLKVARGPYAGLTLDELAAREGAALLGTACPLDEGFPLLVKWLDCEAWLSVQVHPDDRLAREATGDPRARGKSECWLVLEASEGAEVLHGLEPGATVEALARAEGPDMLPLLRRVRPRPGEVLSTPAGTLHALGPGLLLLEVQQSSDLTWRLYDWDRPGLDGRPRPLHRAEALRAAALPTPPPGPPPSGVVGRLEAWGPYFALEVLEEAGSWTLEGRSFEILVQVRGRGTLAVEGVVETLSPGEVRVVPACAASVAVDPGSEGLVARARVP